MNLNGYSKRLEERSFSLYQHRLQAYIRLNRQNNIWNFCLIGSSAIILAISILISNHPENLQLNLSDINLILILASFVNLLLTIVLLYLNFSERARNMFHSYRLAQEISCELELINSQENLNIAVIEKQLDRYQSMLSNSENHTSADRAVHRKQIITKKINELSKSPTPENLSEIKEFKKERNQLRFERFLTRIILEPLPIYIYIISILLTIAFLLSW